MVARNLFEKQGGYPPFVGNYTFTEDHCLNFLRLYPSKGTSLHISDIIDDCYYGQDNDFEWWSLAPNPPETVLNSDAMSEDGDGEGMVDIFFATDELPPLEWSQQVCFKYPTLEVVHDYWRESQELLGRVWFSGGKIYKQAHLTPVASVEVIEHRDNTTRASSRTHLSLLDGSESMNQ